jgi:translation initiation factor RLI1
MYIINNLINFLEINNKMNTCSICLDIIENNNKCVTICEHYFCFLCISKWLYI